MCTRNSDFNTSCRKWTPGQGGQLTMINRQLDRVILSTQSEKSQENLLQKFMRTANVVVRILARIELSLVEIEPNKQKQMREDPISGQNLITSFNRRNLAIIHVKMTTFYFHIKRNLFSLFSWLTIECTSNCDHSVEMSHCHWLKVCQLRWTETNGQQKEKKN